MPRKIQDESLTSEQLKRRERNARYRRKNEANTSRVIPLRRMAEGRLPETEIKKGVSGTSLTSSLRPRGLDLSEWKKCRIMIENPGLLFSLFALLGLTALLTYFQANTYSKEAMSPFLAWSVALMCEFSLMFVTVLYSLNRNRLISSFLFIAFFCYMLGTMAYDIKRGEAVETQMVTDSDFNTTTLRKNIQQVQAAIDLALLRKESGNIAKHMRTLQHLSDDLLRNNVAQPKRVGLIEVKSIGLIILRALLMLIGALLVHQICFYFRTAPTKQMNGR